MNVPFLDFAAHVRGLRGELDLALARVLDSGWFVLGPEGEAFEAELAAALGAKHAVAVANGTDALQLALRALGIGPGDEVVTSPISAAFTALAILQAGARPVFVDVERETLNLDPALVARALTPRTRAILPVHLYGHPADMEPLLELGRAKGIAVLEDACQAHGARYRGRPVGTLAALYLRELAGTGLGLPREQPYAEAVYHLFVVRHPRRDAFAEALAQQGIGTLVHYPVPLHRQPAFADPAGPPRLPVAEQACAEILSLPLYPELTDTQALRVVEAVRAAVSRVRC